MTGRTAHRLGGAVALALTMILGSGCAAVYPELETKVRPAAEGLEPDPPPPMGLRWIRFESAKIPPRARDGREWDQVLGSMPDPVAVLIVNDRELLRSSVASDTLTPTWPDGPRGNFQVGPEDRVRVELWDSNPLLNKPIGVRDLGVMRREWFDQGEIRASLEGGAEVIIAFEPAHPVWGLGLWYEVGNDFARVTRRLEHSPASRAGLEKGDELLMVGDQPVSAMSTGELKSVLGSVPAAGLSIAARRADGTRLEVTLQEGPIYGLFKEYGAID